MSYDRKMYEYEMDNRRAMPAARSDSHETLFTNDFTDSEDEIVKDEKPGGSIPVIPFHGDRNLDDMHENLSDDVSVSKRKEDRQNFGKDEVRADSGLHMLNDNEENIQNISPDISADRTTLFADCNGGVSEDTVAACKPKQTEHKRDVNKEILMHDWKLHDEDLLCAPLVALSKKHTFDTHTVSLGNQRSVTRNMNNAKRLLRRRSGKGSLRLIYVSPLTMIANIAKKNGYDLPTFLETSEFLGGPSYQLPCMQCYEKYGGKSSAGMGYAKDSFSGEGNSRNDKCLTCGGPVQSMASFGRTIRQMRDIIDKKGLVPHDVYPDGNCLFAAVVDQLRIRGDFSYTSQTLRQVAVDYLRKNPTTDDGTPLEMFLTDGETWTAYLARMGDDGEWGDHITLRALANVTNMPFVIYGGTTGQTETILYPTSMPNDLTETQDEPLQDDKVIYLGHVSESHYMSFRPKDWRQNLRKVLQKWRTFPEIPSAEERWTTVPLQHINLILRQVFRLDLIKSHMSEVVDVFVPSRFEKKDCVKELFGSLICRQIPSKVKLDSFGPEVSMFFPSVKEEEKIDGCFQNAIFTAFHTPYDTDIVSSVTSAKSVDLLAKIDPTNTGLLKLVPKTPQLWRGQTTHMIENNIYLKPFEINFSWFEDSKLSELNELSADMYRVLAFKSSWPDVSKQWPNRHRESGFPNEHTIQAVTEKGCHVIPMISDTRMSDILDDPFHFMTNLDDHTWCYSFVAAEKEICRFLSSEQRQSFLIFKALVDTTLKDIPLPVSITKNVFYYACESIEGKVWKSSPGECLLMLLKKLVECLKERHIPHYFMPGKNLLQFIPELTIDECYQRLDCARLQPVVTLYFLLDQLKVLSSEIGSFVEELVGNIQLDAQYRGTNTKLAKQNLLPVYIELIEDLICQEDYQVAMLIFQDIVEEKGNSLAKDGIQVMSKLSHELGLAMVCCFSLYIDVKQKTSLTMQLSRRYATVHITEVLGPDCIEELPDTVVPHCCSIGFGDLFFPEHVLSILRQAVSGKMFIKCMKYYLKTYGEIAGDSLILPAANTLQGNESSSLLTSSSSSLFRLQNIYVQLFNFCDQSNMVEEFREMMSLYALIAESLGTRSSLYNLTYMWDSLGETKKADDASRKMASARETMQY